MSSLFVQNGIADFFCELIGRTRRQECNIFWRVCKSIEISHARYRPLVNMLFGIQYVAERIVSIGTFDSRDWSVAAHVRSRSTSWCG